jgi:hypothetical protein
VLWSTGKHCEVCAKIVQDKAAAWRIEQGLCPEHSTRPDPGGRCVLDHAVRNPA